MEYFKKEKGSYMEKIGFIGLGIMGASMSKNLHKAGYQVMVFDFSEARMQQAKEVGMELAADSMQVARESDIIITMLPNSPDVKRLLLGEEGIAQYARIGALFIDMTSGAPGDSKDIYAELKKKDIHFIDAPVSGGEPMAVAGTLAIMVGGEVEVFERAKPLFDVMGSSATWVGPIGSGNACKLTNQIIVAVNIAGLAEGLMLAKKAGADTQKVFEAIKGGLAGSNVMNAKAPMMMADNYKPGFRIDLHIKDLTNAMNAGSTVAVPMPLTAEMLEIMEKLSANGDGNSDHSAIARYYEELGGITFTE